MTYKIHVARAFVIEGIGMARFGFSLDAIAPVIVVL